MFCAIVSQPPQGWTRIVGFSSGRCNETGLCAFPQEQDVNKRVDDGDDYLVAAGMGVIVFERGRFGHHGGRSLPGGFPA